MQFTLILFLLMISGLAAAQHNSVKGIVKDEAGEPVPFANAALYNSSDSTLVSGATTDVEGKFVIHEQPGNYYLQVSFISYLNKIIPGITLNKPTDLGVIVLKESAQVLEAVIVEGERSQMQLSLDKRVFEVGKDLSNISGSAADILDNVPSVAVDPDGNITLRGSGNVRILIDGRPSGLTGINVADAMRQLQGNMIERVEIITNPSSRYDAEGEVGIINIILKKEKNTTGSFTVHTGYPANYGGSLNLNFRKKKFNYFAGYGLNYRSIPGKGTSFQSFTEGDSSFAYNQTSDRMRSGFSHNVRAGIDYTLSGGGVLTASAVARLSNGLNTTTNIYEDFNSEGAPIRTIIRLEREREPEQNYEGNLSYRKEFDKKGKLWTMDLKWIENREIENSSFEQTDESIDSTGYQRSRNVENERNALFQTDYVQPFAEKGKFEAGVKSTMRVINNNFLVEQQRSGSDQWLTIPQLNNDLIYRENIHAMYIMAGNEHEKFSWQTGVRTELSDIDVALAEGGNSTHQRYINFFPSAHFSYTHAPERTIQLSYSYRLSRPNFRNLAPFSNYSDNRQVQVGNPKLKPEYTHSMEAGYLINLESGSILSNVYYRHRTGVVERVATVDSTAVTSLIPVNLSQQNAYGVEFNISLNPVKWWRFNGNANFYRAVTEGTYNDIELGSDTYTMTSRITSQFTVFKKWNLQTGLNYRAPRVTTQGRDLALYYVDLGLSRDVLKGNGTITLSVRDLFNTRKYRTIINRPDIGYQAERSFQWRTRQALLTFSYRLNLKKQNGDRESGRMEQEDEG